MENTAELISFQNFLGEQIRNGGIRSPEDAVQAFRARERELERLKNELQPALDRHARGQAEPLDYEELKHEVTQFLAEKGITD